jgi:hypothetical protein
MPVGSPITQQELATDGVVTTAGPLYTVVAGISSPGAAFITESGTLRKLKLTGVTPGVSSETYVSRFLADDARLYPSDDPVVTQIYVDNAISTALDDLVDGAPGTLNTLAELSAALNNDPNYLLNHTHAFSAITSKPITLAGYGITDALSLSAAASGYQAKSSVLDGLSALTVTAYGTSFLTLTSAAQLSTVGVQPTLVSGTNIRTINGYSALGSGDVSTSPRLFKKIADFYYCPSLTSSSSSTPLVVDRLYFQAVHIPETTTLTKIAAAVATGAAGAIRLGIYASDPTNGGPGVLLADAGTVDCTSSGVQVLTGLSVPVTPGVYWIAYVSNAACSLRSSNVYTTPNGVHFATGACGTLKYIYRSYPYATLPADETNATHLLIAGASFAMYVGVC